MVDVLFARLRPYLNKVWRAGPDGVCSTEFHVIRIKEDAPDLLSDYPAAVLRSSVVVAQTEHMMTGNTYRRRLEGRRLREETVREWEAAKARYEERLLAGMGSNLYS
jgi:hypothetical protein